jgi:hypothetical protein
VESTLAASDEAVAIASCLNARPFAEIGKKGKSPRGNPWAGSKIRGRTETVTTENDEEEQPTPRGIGVSKTLHTNSRKSLTKHDIYLVTY